MGVASLTLADMYARPDLAAASAEAAEVTAGARRAASGGVLLGAVRSWNVLRSRLETARQVADARFQIDTRDAAAVAEQTFWCEAAPRLRGLDAEWSRALLASPHAGMLDAAYGPRLRWLCAGRAATWAPGIAPLVAEEARLTMRHAALLAAEDIEFRGARTSLAGLGRWFTAADRGTRLEAQQARAAFLERHAGELDALFEALVALRDRMARALGFAGYTPFAYRLLHRRWGPEGVAAVRDEIREAVVPLASSLYAAQARRLGLPQLAFHAEPVVDLAGHPTPAGGAAGIVERAGRMFREMGPETGELFAHLQAAGRLDLEQRAGKAGGAQIVCFPDDPLPLVLASFEGSVADVRVLVHELGHALQVWLCRDAPLAEYRLPTLEACEVHSMALEHLAQPWMSLFFGDGAGRARWLHLREQIVLLPYLALGDEFQHEVYADPGLGPAGRLRMWRHLEERYLPERDYAGLYPRLEAGGLWQRQPHIYATPFYFIDYGLAQGAALQVRRRALGDFPGAMAAYLAMCRVGGRADFEDMLAVGGIESPLGAGVIAREARMAAGALGE